MTIPNGTEYITIIFTLILVMYLCYGINVLNKNKYNTKSEKITWAIVIIFIPIIGTLLYFLLGNKIADSKQIN